MPFPRKPARRALGEWDSVLDSRLHGNDNLNSRAGMTMQALESMPVKILTGLCPLKNKCSTLFMSNHYCVRYNNMDS